MKERINSWFRQLPEVSRYLIAAAVVFAISFLFPDHLKFNYQFETGKPWAYEDLKAPFDFGIQKEEAEIKRKLDSIKAQLEPCYYLNPTVKEQKIEEYITVFNKKFEEHRDLYGEDLSTNTTNYQNTGRAILSRFYDRGILRLAPQHASKSRNILKVLDGRTITERNLTDFVEQFDAVGMIKDSLLLSGKPEVDFYLKLFEDNANFIAPNLIYNDSLTTALNQQELNAFSQSRGKVKEGTLIVAKKEVVSEATYQKLISLKEAYEARTIKDSNYTWMQIGYLVLTSFIILIFVLFLKYQFAEIYGSFIRYIFMFLWILIYSYLVYWVENTNLLSTYIIPFCIAPIVIKNFYNSRLALFTHIIIVLIASYLTSLGYEFTVTQILAGIVVIIANVTTRYWSDFFFSMLFILMTYLVVYFGLALIQEADINSIPWQTAIGIGFSVFLTLLSYPLVPLMERIFGFTSDITLVELSNMDNPLLKELSIKAPGTLQHSLQVANLSEAAANAIGAKALLVKVAALYHDIGKMAQPYYYIENQNGPNPHDNLSPLESAKIIIGHIEEGVKMAKKGGLPKVLINFIHTHHGTTRAEYFYRQYQKQNPDIEVDESLFRYAGPSPRTKEEVILMIADSLEAACKSIQSPTEERLNDMIEKVIAGKINSGQLENSDITFKELEIIKVVFKKLLKSIYHVRIQYAGSPKQLDKGKT